MTEASFELKNNWYVLRDVFIAIFFGIVLGMSIDIVFPYPAKIDSVWKCIGLILLQIAICGFIIYYYSVIYTWIFKSDADDFRGFTVFGVLFFLVQVQLLARLNFLFQRLTGKSFD